MEILIYLIKFKLKIITLFKFFPVLNFLINFLKQQNIFLSISYLAETYLFSVKFSFWFSLFNIQDIQIKSGTI